MTRVDQVDLTFFSHILQQGHCFSRWLLCPVGQTTTEPVLSHRFCQIPISTDAANTGFRTAAPSPTAKWWKRVGEEAEGRKAEGRTEKGEESCLGRPTSRPARDSSRGPFGLPEVYATRGNAPPPHLPVGGASVSRRFRLYGRDKERHTDGFGKETRASG